MLSAQTTRRSDMTNGDRNLLLLRTVILNCNNCRTDGAAAFSRPGHRTQTHTHVYIYIYIHTYTNIPTYIHTYIPTYIHTNKHTYIHTYIHTDRQTDRQTDSQPDRQTDRQIYIYIYIYLYLYLSISISIYSTPTPDSFNQVCGVPAPTPSRASAVSLRWVLNPRDRYRLSTQKSHVERVMGGCLEPESS